MSRPAPIHLCYYSLRCPHSKRFIEELNSTKYISDFKFICVDPSPQRPALPPWLKQTPTIVIRGEKEPRIDNDVINWIYEQRVKDSGSDPNAELGTFLDMKMGGHFGDMYSFLDDKSGQQESMMMHNFEYLNGNDAIGSKEAFTVQSEPANTKRSKKEEMFEAQYSQFMENRDRGMPQKLNRQ